MDRMKRERETIKAMVRIYCKERHGNQKENCNICKEFEDFSLFRLSKCPFQENKPPCQSCTVHCYKPKKEMQELARDVMRTAGPKMVFKHPYFAFMHLLDKFRKIPTLKK